MGHSEGELRRGHSHGEHEPRNSGGGGDLNPIRTGYLLGIIKLCRCCPAREPGKIRLESHGILMAL